MLSGWQAIVASQDDGSFQIAVPPGKGHLLVFGPTGDYVLGEIGSNRLYSDRPGGMRYHAHAIIPYEVKAGDPPHEVAAALRPGVTIKGRVEGPDGQTVTDGFILTTLHIEPFNPSWRGDYQVPVRDGRFELHGLAPEASTRIHVLDPEHEWGASVEVSGKQAGEDLTIRLSPAARPGCGSSGPTASRSPSTSPTSSSSPRPARADTAGASRTRPSWRPTRIRRQRRPQALLERPAHRRRGPHHPARPDPRRTVPDHRLLDGQRPGKGAQIRKDFTVKPGETLDLGDILIEKPRE